MSSNIAYGTSNGYMSVKSGSHQVAIEPSGTTTALLQQSITFASGSDTTIVSSNYSSNIANLVLTDDNSAPDSGKFRLRVVNAAPGLGPADVYISRPGNRSEYRQSYLDQFSLSRDCRLESAAAGSYEVVLTPVGQKFTAIDTGSVAFSSGQVRTFVSLNSQSGGFSYALLHDVN